MQTRRHIGIDLHRNRFTCCVRLDNGRNYLSQWKVEDLPRFVKKLRPSDEIAVEVTGNTRLFYEAVVPHVARVVAVDPNQFQVISQYPAMYVLKAKATAPSTVDGKAGKASTQSPVERAISKALLLIIFLGRLPQGHVRDLSRHSEAVSHVR